MKDLHQSKQIQSSSLWVHCHMQLQVQKITACSAGLVDVAQVVWAFPEDETQFIYLLS